MSVEWPVLLLHPQSDLRLVGGGYVFFSHANFRWRSLWSYGTVFSHLSLLILFHPLHHRSLSKALSSHYGFPSQCSSAFVIVVRSERSNIPSATHLLSVIPGDYHTQLTHLLRYPSPRSLGASQISDNAPGLLLTQAQLLLMSPTPGTGVTLVMQNRNELGIPVEIPDSPPRPLHRRGASSVAATFPQMASQGKAGHERPRLQDMITSRIMDANETLGIQRGFLNTISELRVCLLPLLLDYEFIRRLPLEKSSRYISDAHSATNLEWITDIAC